MGPVTGQQTHDPFASMWLPSLTHNPYPWNLNPLVCGYGYRWVWVWVTKMWPMSYPCKLMQFTTWTRPWIQFGTKLELWTQVQSGSGSLDWISTKCGNGSLNFEFVNWKFSPVQVQTKVQDQTVVSLLIMHRVWLKQNATLSAKSPSSST